MNPTHESPYLGTYPFPNVEGNLFPPVCLRTHWDPTKIIKRTLPLQHIILPQAFRPLVKVCKEYVTSGPLVTAPMPPKHMVFPMGGEFYPPGRYSAHIDEESALRTLESPLDKWCHSNQYIPSMQSNMYISGSTVPERKAMVNGIVSELAMPQSLLRTNFYNCRSENDFAYFQKSGRLFNNPTKQDRYGAEKYYAQPGGLAQGQPMPHGGVPQVPLTEQAKQSQFNVPMPGRNDNGRNGNDNGINPLKGARSTYFPGTTGKGCTSVVGVATCGAAAPVW